MSILQNPATANDKLKLVDASLTTHSNSSISSHNFGSNHEKIPSWLVSFTDIYKQLNVDNISSIEQVYAKDVTFSDPLHKVEGLTNLLNYFKHLYANINYCHFTICDVITENNRAALYWKMDFSHPKLNSGKNISVMGTSKLESDGRYITTHRDYFDMGSMLYEHISLLGTVVKLVKRKAATVSAN